MTLVKGEKKGFVNGVRVLRGDFISDTKVAKADLPETWDNERYVVMAGSTVMTPQGDIAIKGEEGWGDWI